MYLKIVKTLMLLEILLVKTPSNVVNISSRLFFSLFFVFSHNIFAHSFLSFCLFAHSPFLFHCIVHFLNVHLARFCKSKMLSLCLRIWFECKWFEVFAVFSITLWYLNCEQDADTKKNTIWKNMYIYTQNYEKKKW